MVKVYEYAKKWAYGRISKYYKVTNLHKIPIFANNNNNNNVKVCKERDFLL